MTYFFISWKLLIYLHYFLSTLAETKHLPTMLSKKAPRRCQSFLSFKKVIIWDRRTSLAFWRPKKTHRRVIPFSISVCFTIFSGSLSKVTTFCWTISCKACNSARGNRTNILADEKQHVHVYHLLLELQWQVILKNTRLGKMGNATEPQQFQQRLTKDFRLSMRWWQSQRVEKCETFLPRSIYSKLVATSTKMILLILYI